VTKARGLKGSRKLQGFGGISIATATTDGLANSANVLSNVKLPTFTTGMPFLTTLGVTGTASTEGTSFGSSNTFSPGFGTSQATGAANGFGNSTSKQVGGVVTPAATGVPEVLFGNGFGDFAASGGGTSSFGSPLGIPGLGVVPGLQTGGGGAGFGFTLGGGIGNVSGDLSYSEAYGTAQSAGFGSAQGASLFGTAGGSGGGTSIGDGGGIASPSTKTPATTGLATGDLLFGITLFNGTGGGLASGGAGGYVGFNPNTPVVLGVFPLGAP
jgi:hypothetical protein